MSTFREQSLRISAIRRPLVAAGAAVVLMGCSDAKVSWLDLTAGVASTCVVSIEGHTQCRGYLADDSPLPEARPPQGLQFIEVDLATASSGTDVDHACGLTLEGEAVCWGSSPVREAGPFVHVSPGETHACALRPDGSVHCWGSDAQGLLEPPQGAFVQLGSGGWFSCGIREAGTVACWGATASGFTPPQDLRFSSLSASSAGWCGLLMEGGMHCEHAWLQALPGEQHWRTVGVGRYHACTLTQQGALTCWGQPPSEHDFGQTDAPSGTFTDVAVGLEHTCALSARGEILCWGRNDWGQCELEG